MQVLSEIRCFGGKQLQVQHRSAVLHCDMRFSIYLPPQVFTEQPSENNSENHQKNSSKNDENGKKVPALYWLSGLTCTDDNFSQKAGAQRIAAELGMALVIPDTSPRGENVPDDPEGAYDFGLGAGFYLNATEAPFDQHYHMYDYIVAELPTLVESEFPLNGVRAISGHSMGGHGAITIGLKNPDRYQSISAFSPICNPMDCPWGQKAFSGYLGSQQSDWSNYDSVELMKKLDINQQENQQRNQQGTLTPILIDQGLSDNFLDNQLKPHSLIKIASDIQYPLTYRDHEGYDHSYFFIASFIEDHLRFHAEYLSA